MVVLWQHFSFTASEHSRAPPGTRSRKQSLLRNHEPTLQSIISRYNFNSLGYTYLSANSHHGPEIILFPVQKSYLNVLAVWLFHQIPEIPWQRTTQILLSLGDKYRDIAAVLEPLLQHDYKAVWWSSFNLTSRLICLLYLFPNENWEYLFSLSNKYSLGR